MRWVTLVHFHTILAQYNNMYLGLDLGQLKLKVDHFAQLHVLGPEKSIAGAPNFRQVLVL